MAGSPEKAVLLLQDLYDAFEKQDATRIRDLVAEEAEWHVPGRNLLAGTYRGHAQIFGYFARIQELSGGTFRADPRDILGGSAHGATLSTVTARREGLHYHGTYCMTFRFRDGRIVEARLYPEDQGAFDAFWS
ncbi:MAG TPA: nuclear transport factor 2 family protein [Candidatus Thermoplasmatota archaeon]|nr:nuclear transport factor 2 family protein [Candidatus Thermoplasmatota archaeon]